MSKRAATVAVTAIATLLAPNAAEALRFGIGVGYGTFSVCSNNLCASAGGINIGILTAEAQLADLGGVYLGTRGSFDVTFLNIGGDTGYNLASDAALTFTFPLGAASLYLGPTVGTSYGSRFLFGAGGIAGAFFDLPSGVGFFAESSLTFYFGVGSAAKFRGVHFNF